MRILVIEDEKDLCDAIAEGLELDGYAVDKSYDGQEAFELMMIESYDLAILDLNLPKMDGMNILREVRKQNKEVKVIILSARSAVSNKILGLDTGANDYLAKPFEFAELEARIRSLLRRNFTQENVLLHFHGICLDTAKRSVIANGETLALTKKELAILEYLLLNAQRIISQEELIEHVWSMEADSFSNVVRVHIASLRKKLKAVLGTDVIQTKIGEGYYLDGGVAR